MSDLQSNLQEFIRRLGVDDDRLDQLERRTTALSQGIRNLWTDGTGKGSACLTTFSASVTGCTQPLTLLFDSTVRVVGHTSGIDYGTMLAPSGTVTFGLVLAQSETYDIYIKGPTARYVEILARVSPQSVTPCATNNVGGNAQGSDWPSNFNGWAPGYHPYLGCNIPIADSLSLVDSRTGTSTTVTHGAGPFGADWGVILSPSHRYLFTSHGPGQGGIKLTAQVASVNYDWVMGRITSTTCPTTAGGKFSMTLTWSGAGAGPYVAGDTITVFEP